MPPTVKVQPAYSASAVSKETAASFRNGVGGHDGASGTIPRGFIKDIVQRRNTGFEGGNIKLLADDARRSNQHVFGHAADR